MILQCRSLLVVALMAVSLHADQGKGKPSINVRVSPAVAFAPARIVATAEIVGGADDFQDFYCAKVEWSWGDSTQSEASDDCDPYVAGESKIRRRYTNEHKFEFAGNYDIRITLRQGKKSVGSGTVTVRVRDGHAELVPQVR